MINANRRDDAVITEPTNAVKTDGVALQSHHPIPQFRKNNIRVTLTNLVKLALDSALNSHSSKGSSSGPKKLHGIVQERLKELPTPIPSDNPLNAGNGCLNQKMQSEMEAMREEMENVKLQNKTTVISQGEREPEKKLPDEGIKGAAPSEIEKKRNFIRSRL